jgi:hypothetical protein
MPPPDAERGAPARRPVQKVHVTEPDRIVARGSDTLTYLQGRERILGRHRRLHVHDAEIAASQLVEAVGLRLGLEWARELLAELVEAAR